MINWRTSDLSADDLIDIGIGLREVGFEHVRKEDFEHNHAEKLKHWLDSEFLLFRHSISVDHYLAFDLTRRGDGQFLPISMCREYNSDNYINREGTYYLTLRQINAIETVMEIIQEKFNIPA